MLPGEPGHVLCSGDILPAHVGTPVTGHPFPKERLLSFFKASLMACLSRPARGFSAGRV